MNLEEILEKAEEICRREGVSRLYLFGSYARGDAIDTSDVDLAVSGVSDIGLLREQIEQIPTLKRIDVVDMDHIQNPHLMDEIKNYGQKIYESI